MTGENYEIPCNSFSASRFIVDFVVSVRWHIFRWIDFDRVATILTLSYVYNENAHICVIVPFTADSIGTGSQIRDELKMKCLTTFKMANDANDAKDEVFPPFSFNFAQLFW